MSNRVNELVETARIHVRDAAGSPDTHTDMQATPDALAVPLYRWRVASIIVLQVLLAIALFFFNWFYGMIHNVPSFMSILFAYDVEDFAERVNAYNFIGVTSAATAPSFYAIFVEVFFWASAGVLARSEFYLTQIVFRQQPISILSVISKVIGDCAMGVSIAMAVIAFLESTQFLNLTLKGANIETIAAISFILGFYHEKARYLLEGFQKRVSGTALEIKETQEETSS